MSGFYIGQSVTINRGEFNLCGFILCIKKDGIIEVNVTRIESDFGAWTGKGAMDFLECDVLAEGGDFDA